MNVTKYIQALNKAALIELVDGAGNLPDHRWRLVRDEGAEYPQVTQSGARSNRGAGLEGLWRSLRIIGEMTAAQAAELASAGGASVTQAHAYNYFAALTKAGYLVVSEYDFQGPCTYKLAPGMSTGPRYPIIQRSVSVQIFDPNLNQVVYSSVESGSVSGESSPSNDMQEQNSRLKKLLAEFVSAGVAGPEISLIQRAQLELA